jgi:hypothetical protein
MCTPIGKRKSRAGSRTDQSLFYQMKSNKMSDIFPFLLCVCVLCVEGCSGEATGKYSSKPKCILFFFWFSFLSIPNFSSQFQSSGRLHCVGCDSDFSILFRISVWMEEFVEKILGGKRQADVNEFKAFLNQKVLRRNALQVKVKEAGNKCHRKTNGWTG